MSDEKKPDRRTSDQSLAWKAQGSPMAREVKIGVSVIFVLLVVFGIALFNRLKGSDSESTALAAEKGVANNSGGTNAAAPVEPQSGEVIEALSASTEALGGAPDVRSDDWDPPSSTDTSADTANQLQSLYMPDEGDVAPVIATAGEESGTVSADPVAWETGEAASTRSTNTQALSVSGGRMAGESTQSAPKAFEPAPLQPVQGAPRADSQSPASQARSNGGAIQAKPQWGNPPGRSANAFVSPASPQQNAALANPSPPGALDASPRATFKAAQTYDSASTESYGGSTQMQFGTQAVAENGTYVVQPNDNYWLISERVYGTGAFFQALAEHNRGVHSDENWLRLGEKISVPSTEELEKLYPALCPTREHRLVAQRHASVMHTASHSLGGRIYIVQEGDSLFDIARHELGRASRYGEIIRMNQDVLGGQFDYLTPGMQLVLPDVGQSNPSQVTTRPQGYQR